MNVTPSSPSFIKSLFGIYLDFILHFGMKACHGKGLHYFLRDIIYSLKSYPLDLIRFDDYFDASPKISSIANMLIRKAGDTNKHHFMNNMALIGGFMAKYSHHIVINHQHLLKLL